MVTKKGKTPRRGRRWLVVVAVITVAALVVGVLAWTGRIDLPFIGKSSKPGLFQVDEEGGTYNLPSGGSITVPKGAVDKPTTLTVTPPRQLQPGEAAPLQGMSQGGIAFDVSLSRDGVRNIQPAENKPLELTLPIEAPQPKNGEYMLPLPYTGVTTDKGEAGYGMLPHKPAGASKLAIQLPHLSPKFVVYVTNQELLDAFDPEPIKKNRDKCDDDLTVGGVKVKIDHNKSRGWSLKDDSPIFACLAKSEQNPNDYVRLNVLNHIDYLMSVAATDNVRTTASRGNAETEVIKALARGIFNLPKVKQYVGENGKFVGSIEADSLYDRDAIVELQADPHTFLAEGVWRALNVLTIAFTGSSAGDALKMAKELVTATSVTTCFQDVAEKHGGNIREFGFAVDIVFGCTKPILEILAKHSKFFDLLNRGKELWDLKNDLVASLEHSWNGIRLTLANTLRVTVVAEPPPCPTMEDIKRTSIEVAQEPNYDGDKIHTERKVISVKLAPGYSLQCGKRQMEVETEVKWIDPPNIYGDTYVGGVTMVYSITYRNGRWVQGPALS